MNEKPLPTFTDAQIGRIIKKRVCARCYNDLIKQPAPNRRWYALCHYCDNVWHGAHISRRYAEELGQKALSEMREVKHTLSDLYEEFKPAAQKVRDRQYNAMSESEQIAALMGF